MAIFINPLDFEVIFLQILLGGTGLFSVIFVLALSYGCAKYQIDDKYYLLLLSTGSLLFAVYLGESLLLLILLIFGFLVFKPLSKLFSR